MADKVVIVSMTKSDLDALIKEYAKKEGLIPSDMEISNRAVGYYIQSNTIQFSVPVKPKE